MLRNYLKIAFRQAWRNPATSLINIGGLAIGITVCLLIGLYVWDEWQFDQYHPDKDRVFRITSARQGEASGPAEWAGTSPALGPALEANFPEVEETLRLFQIRSKQLFTRGADSYLEQKGFFAENSIFDMFYLPLRFGQPAGALSRPNTIVLSDRMAKKYFGDSDPVGQTLQVGSNEITVTGVLQPLSPHFHLDFDYLLSFQNLLDQVPEERIQSWVWQDFYNYVKVYPGTQVDRLAGKLNQLIETDAHPQTKAHGFYYYANWQALPDIHLHSSLLTNDVAKRANYRYINGLALVGLFLLLIACINFINLSTARAAQRAPEVGVRKATGAMRGQLRGQFLVEAVVVVALATALALPLANLALPHLNDLTGKAMSFPLFSDPVLSLSLVAFTLLVGLLAGAYPAFVLSGFRPAAVLKGGLVKPSGQVSGLRKALVTLQFGLSILLISCLLILFRQVKFLNQTDLGFQKEQLIHFPMRGSMFRNVETAKAEFNALPGVVSASACFGIPGDIVSGDNIIVPGADRRNLPARIFNVDHEYVQTMGMELVAGRDFSRAIPTDTSTAFILNETAVADLGIAETPQAAIGKRLEWKMWTDQDTIKKGTVIGVVRDFHYSSLHEPVQTAVLQIYPDAYWKMALRLHTNDLSTTIAAIEDKWEAFDTGYPIDYQFVDAGFGAMYEEEQKLSTMLLVFTVLAIAIACIGAFGLAVFAAEQRRKEIGIRKVLGASVPGLVSLLSRDFLKLVFLAFLLATPVAWLAMRAWLEDFAYRIDIQWWYFALAGLLVGLIAFLTVGLQGLRSALADPVRALRSE